MKSSLLVAGIALAGVCCAPAAQAVTLSCKITAYQEKRAANGDAVSSNDRSIGSRFRVDTSDGWRTTDTQYLKSETFSGANGTPVNTNWRIDRESGELEKSSSFSGASYTLVAVCKKVDVKVNM
jgi:hypothetical protein